MKQGDVSIVQWCWTGSTPWCRIFPTAKEPQWFELCVWEGRALSSSVCVNKCLCLPFTVLTVQRAAPLYHGRPCQKLLHVAGMKRGDLHGGTIDVGHPTYWRTCLTCNNLLDLFKQKRLPRTPSCLGVARLRDAAQQLRRSGHLQHLPSLLVPSSNARSY